MKTHPLPFNLPKDLSSIIKVIGVGGGGSNAVNYMHRLGIKGVDFAVCNTDSQVLDLSPVPNKIQLGSNLTKGLGAGNNPDMGRNAALESIEELKKLLSSNTRMVFITAGMGGGTGTGAAPVLAGAAKEMGILTVGIVTTPFLFEGPNRREQAYRGIMEMQKNVDTLLIVCNDKIREMYGDMDIDTAFEQADNVLASAAKGIAEIITVPGKVNVDFQDVKTVMTNGGVAILGSSFAEGDDRARNAVEKALTSPLLNDNKINGAKHILLNITYGKKKITMDEVTEITEFVHAEAGNITNMIWGHAFDPALENKVNVTIIATGYPSHTESLFDEMAQSEKKIKPLGKAQMIVNNSSENEEPNEALSTPSGENGGTSELRSFKKPDQPREEKLSEQTSISFNFENSSKGNSAPEGYKKERIQRLKDLSYRMKTNSGLTDIEREPAFIRRNVKLDTPPHSSESEISRYSLGVTEDPSGKKTPEIKPGNSFLHDNVD